MNHVRKSSARLRPSENRRRIAAIVLMAALSVSAVIAGCLFMKDPSGHALGIAVDYIQYSPFTDFFVPGLVLLLVNGILPLFVISMALVRSRLYPTMILVQGVVLCGWIIVQVIMVHSVNMLHVICIGVGIALIAIGQKLLALAARRRRFSY